MECLCRFNFFPSGSMATNWQGHAPIWTLWRHTKSIAKSWKTLSYWHERMQCHKLSRGASTMDCNLEGKTQTCVNLLTYSRISWTYESLHELVSSKFKSFLSMVCNTSKRYRHISLNSRDANWTTSSTTKPTSCCQHAWWRTTTTSLIILVHATTTSSSRL